MGRRYKSEERVEAERLLREGMPVAEASSLSGINANVVGRISSRLRREGILCRCGYPIGHSNCCRGQITSRRKLPPNRELLRLVSEENLSFVEIAKRYGTTYQAVQQKLGPGNRPIGCVPRKSQILRENRDEIIEKLMNGTSKAEIGRQYKVSGTLVNMAFPGTYWEAPHGTSARYDHHRCRCDLCRRAATVRHRIWAAQHRAKMKGTATPQN